MRLTLITCCLLTACVSSMSCFGADTDAPAKATNSICPVSGEKIDASVTPVEAKTTDGKTVEIGCCCSKCQAVVKKHPDDYADAAASNTQRESQKGK